MTSLADQIEKYLSRLIKKEEGKTEIKRNQLAEEFDCAPSQINYVLNTRFTTEKGFIVESQRGGAGYIRIIKISIESIDKSLRKMIAKAEQPLTQREAQGIISRLYENGIINDREKSLMDVVVHRRVIGTEIPTRDFVRGRLIKSMLEVILKTEESK
ncbi:MAG: CtsR family transcriptional regulator [Bacillota bacterium]